RIARARGAGTSAGVSGSRPRAPVALSDVRAMARTMGARVNSSGSRRCGLPLRRAAAEAAAGSGAEYCATLDARWAFKRGGEEAVRLVEVRSGATRRSFAHL